MSAVWAGKFQFFILTTLLAMDYEAAGCYVEPDPWDDGGLIEDNVDPSQPCELRLPFGDHRLCIRPVSSVAIEKDGAMAGSSLNQATTGHPDNSPDPRQSLAEMGGGVGIYL